MYYNSNLRKATLENTSYRKELATIGGFQLVLMNLKPKEDIGLEVHPETTQYFFIEEGVGMAIVGGDTKVLALGVCLIVPPGTRHNIINTSKNRHLRLRTVYVPPEHPKGTNQKTKY